MVVSAGANAVNYFFFAVLSLFSVKLTGTVNYAGFLSLAFSATALITRPISGMLSDKYGRVRLIIFGTALSALSCVLYTLTTDLALLLLIRILNGFGMSMCTTCAGAAIPDIVPGERLTEGLGIFGLSATASQALGPTIALAIIGGGELSSFNTLFIVSAVLCCMSSISACFITYESKKRVIKEERPKKIDTDRDCLPDAAEGKSFFGIELKIISLIVVFTLIFAGNSSVLGYLTRFGQLREFQTEHIGLYFFVSAGGMLLSRILLGKTVDRRGADIVVIPSLIVLALCLAAIPVMPSLPLLVCTSLPQGFAMGALSPTINATMFKRSSPKRRGAVAASFYIAIDVGITVGAPVMGLIADHISFDWVYWFAAIIVVFALIVYMRFGSDKRYTLKSAQ